MNKMDENNKVLNKVPINYSNSFRISFSESEFNFDFGIKGPDNNMTVVSSASIPVTLAEELLFSLLIGIKDYEEEYGTTILSLGDSED